MRDFQQKREIRFGGTDLSRIVVTQQRHIRGGSNNAALHKPLAAVDEALLEEEAAQSGVDRRKASRTLDELNKLEESDEFDVEKERAKLRELTPQQQQELLEHLREQEQRHRRRRKRQKRHVKRRYTSNTHARARAHTHAHLTAGCVCVKVAVPVPRPPPTVSLSISISITITVSSLKPAR
ncbi:MAG: hypothetical protein MHM6MM_008710 [Cercozoa sp. M6MM]